MSCCDEEFDKDVLLTFPVDDDDTELVFSKKKFSMCDTCKRGGNDRSFFAQ